MKTNCRKTPLTFGELVAAAFVTSTEPYVEPSMPLPPVRNTVQTAWRKAGFPVRIIAKWRMAIASYMPVGYEDETGFHYGVEADD